MSDILSQTSLLLGELWYQIIQICSIYRLYRLFFLAYVLSYAALNHVIFRRYLHLSMRSLRAIIAMLLAVDSAYIYRHLPTQLV